MNDVTPTRIRVEVDVHTPAERVLADWLRSWRRRGVGQDGKPTHVHQGASIVRRFHAPPAAVAELELRLAGVASATLTREPDER
jgi:hypothetical protein